jgi:hypothetical protein
LLLFALHASSALEHNVGAARRWAAGRGPVGLERVKGKEDYIRRKMSVGACIDAAPAYVACTYGTHTLGACMHSRALVAKYRKSMYVLL